MYIVYQSSFSIYGLSKSVRIRFLGHFCSSVFSQGMASLTPDQPQRPLHPLTPPWLAPLLFLHSVGSHCCFRLLSTVGAFRMIYMPATTAAMDVKGYNRAVSCKLLCACVCFLHECLSSGVKNSQCCGFLLAVISMPRGAPTTWLTHIHNQK